jgi:hypothetical protein
LGFLIIGYHPSFSEIRKESFYSVYRKDALSSLSLSLDLS